MESNTLCLLFRTFLILFFCTFTSATNSSDDELDGKIPLYFAYITTFTGGFIASGGIPIVDMALQQINSRDDVLTNYTLGYTEILDSGCNRTRSLNTFFELIKSENVFVTLLGCGCSTATLPVAEISHYWNIPQIAYAAGAYELNERHRFRNFFRALPPFEYIAASLAQLIRHFGWRQMAIITQQESLFMGVTENLDSIFKKEQILLDRTITIRTGESFFPYSLIFKRILAKKNRIIHINTYPDMAYRILCEAYYRRMFSPEYVWILPMWYNDNFWKIFNNSSCTDEIMIQVLNGTIGTVPDGYFPVDSDTLHTFSGIIPSNFTNIYTSLLQQPQYQNLSELSIAGVAYDAVWSMAIGLDRATRKIAKGNDSGCENLPGDLVPLEYFNYTNEKLGCIIRQSFSEVQFIGVTGPVIYNENGSRPDNILLIRQYRLKLDGSIGRYTIGYVVIGNNNDTFTFSMGESNDRIWKNGEIPYDGFSDERIHTINIVLFIIYNTAAIVGIGFAILCFIFNIIFRNKKVIKLSSPNLNYLIIVGATILYICVFFYTYPNSNAIAQTTFCNVRIWLFSLGYTICFAVILSKTWRIYYIFNNPKPQKKALKDWVLFLIISVIVTVDLVIVFIGASISQTRLISSMIPDIEHPEVIDEGRVVKEFIFICTQPGSFVWLSISFGYKALLQLVAVFMAFHTRRVKVKALNDSKEITAIIYINSIILALLVVTEFALVKYHYVYAAVFGLGLLIEGFLFLGLVFIPKTVSLYFDPNGDKVFSHSIPPPDGAQNLKPTQTCDEAVTVLQAKVKELESKLIQREIIITEEMNSA